MTPDELFYELHQGLARQAPRIGCNHSPPGNTCESLARRAAQITAIDDHQPFLDDLAARAVETGLSGLIRTQLAAMEALPFEDGAFDLIWAEGSAYVMGFDAALASWRRLLAPGGALVLRECEWITLTPSAATRGFWDVAYPAMRSTAANVDAAMAASWKVAATYVLPDADWEEYYGPLGRRLANHGPVADELRWVLDSTRTEINLRVAHGDEYSYTGYVLR